MGSRAAGGMVTHCCKRFCVWLAAALRRGARLAEQASELGLTCAEPVKDNRGSCFVSGCYYLCSCAVLFTFLFLCSKSLQTRYTKLIYLVSTQKGVRI